MRSSQGFALLEALRPPLGFRTTAALGTTYSADLVTCMVALVALDGACRDEAMCSKLDAFRALERLGPVVRIAAQQGRVTAHRKVSPRVLALLDRVVRPVSFDPRSRSFHPKVWVVRQEHEDTREVRYLLSVSSRNLSTHAAWDFGITLTGSLRAYRQVRTRSLERVAAFTTWVGTLIGDPGVSERFPDLDNMQWELPENVLDAEFGFLGADGEEASERPPLFAMPKRGRVLLVSPFVTKTMILESARHWRSAEETWLVAGARDLDEAVRTAGDGKSLFGAIKPHCVDVADLDTASTERLQNGQGEELEERGLHAKVFVVDDGERASMLLGSANLTNRAWSGSNAEAYVRLRVESAGVEPLWTWVGENARRYEPPPASTLSAPAPDRLGVLRDTLSAARFTLVDHPDGQPSELSIEPPPDAVLLEGHQLRLARFTLPEYAVPWDKEAAITLPSCRMDERTTFVVVELTGPGGALTWVQATELSPPLDTARDQDAIVRLLGARGFVDLIGGILAPAASEGGGDLLETDDEEDGRGCAKPSPKRKRAFHLEELLRRLTRDDHALQEVDRIVERYQVLLQGLSAAEAERTELESFLALWGAVSAGMRLP